MLAVIADYVKSRRHRIGQHVLFVGSGVRLVGELSVAAILEQIALEHSQGRFDGLPVDRRGREALAYFAAHVPDHAERARLLRERLDGVRPPEGFIRLAGLIKDGYFPTIFTAGPHDLLERALSTQHLEAGKDYHLLVAGVDAASSFAVDIEESTRVAVVKCGGDVGSRHVPMSLDEVSDSVNAIREAIDTTFRSLCIFTGYHHRDRPFIEATPREGGKVFWVNTVIPMKDRELYEELKVENPASIEYHQLQPEVTALLDARHSSRHLLVREAGSFNEFMTNLHNRLHRQSDRFYRRRRHDLTVLRGGPYRFLDYFDVSDSQFFFGREDETKLLLEMVEQRPLTVLFGRSAIGKTSLLRAGVMAELARKIKDEGSEKAEQTEEPRPRMAIYTLCEDDPAQSIRRAAAAAAEEAGVAHSAVLEEGLLHEALAALSKGAGRPLLVILDQFEEFFVKLGARVREQFVQEVARLVGSYDGSVALLLSVREDFVGELWELHEQLPEILQHMLRLRKLGREQAKQAFVRPAQNFYVQIEPDLVDAVLEDLWREGIEPARLQIVCERLYESLTPGSYVLTVRHYERLGGAERILAEYVDYALSQVTAPERRIARAILKSLATFSELKAARTLDRLATELSMPEEAVERVLAKLVDLRLLRGIERGRHRSYELMHEYLAADIARWLSEDELKVKDVQDLLTRELSNYTKFELLMDAETLRIVTDHRAHLSLSPVELEMIIRSAVSAGVEESEWLRRLDDLGPRRSRVLARMMTDPEQHVRSLAYQYLPDPPEIGLMGALIQGLRDREATIRTRARAALEGMQNSLRAALHAEGPVSKVEAAFALGTIAPEQHAAEMLDGLTDGDDEYRDAVQAALDECRSDRIVREALERLARGGESAPWALAYVTGNLIHDEAMMRELERLAQAKPSPRVAYALALAESQWRDFDAAERTLRGALRAADEYGAGLIERALESIVEQRRRADSGDDRWPMFGRNPAHTSYTAQALRPPLARAWGFRTGGTLMGGAAVSDGAVFFGSRDGTLYAVGRPKGAELWRLETDDRIEATPAVSDGLVFVGSYDRSLYAADARTGQMRWTRRLSSETRSSCVVAGGRLWLGSRDGTVYCFNASSGQPVWERRMAAEVSGAPALEAGVLVVGVWDGTIGAVRADSGEPLWRMTTEGPVSCTPAIADSTVYCGSDDRCLYALDLSTGAARWTAELGTQVRAAVAIAGDRLVVGGINGGIFCLSRENGRQLWRADAEEEILASPAISADVAYVGSRDGTLYALALNDGRTLWSHSTAYGIYTSATIAEDTLYIGLEHNELVAFRSESA